MAANIFAELKWMGIDCELVSEFEYAYSWLDEDDAHEYIKNILKNEKEYDVIPMRVSYEILDMSEIGE